MKPIKITQEVCICSVEMCETCGRYTEYSEIDDGRYLVETWRCDSCNKRFCSECWNYNEVQKSFYTQTICTECFCNKNKGDK